MSKESVLDLVFAGGFDESQRDELLDPAGAFGLLENGRYPAIGGYAKRWGFDALTTLRIDDSARPGGLAMFARQKETCVIASDGRLDSYSYALGRNATIGRVPELYCDRFPVASSGVTALDGTLESLAVTFANGLYFVAVAYLISGTPGVNAFYVITIYVVDRKTKQIVARIPSPFGNTTFTAAMHTKLCATGNTVVCVTQQGANLNGFTIDATSYATIHAGPSALVTLATDSTQDDFDVCGLETSFAIVYPNTSGATHRVTVKRFSPAMGILFTGTSITTNNQTTAAVAIDGSEADNIWVAWSDTLTGNKCRVIALAPDCTTITGTAYDAFQAESGTPNRLGIKRASATDSYVCGRGQSAITANWFHFSWSQNRIVAGACASVLCADGANVNKGRTLGWTPYSQPFMLGSRVYAWQVNSNEPNGTSTATAPVGNMVCFDMTAYQGPPTLGGAPNANGGSFQRPLASPASGLNSYVRDAFWSCRKVVNPTATVAATVGVVKTNNSEASVEIIEVDNANPARWQTAEHNGLTCLSSGQMYGYDGQQLFEIGFVAPPSMRATDSGNAGNVNGTVTYCAIVEWSDGEGNIHWSEPSAPTTLTIANKQVSINILGFGATWKDGQTDTFDGVHPPIDGPYNGVKARLKIFRTKDGGGDFFLVSTIVNLSGANTAPITDNLTDAVIGANEQLYTAPGTPGTNQVRRCPTACRSITNYNGQIILVAEDGRSVWASAARTVGEGLWFNPIWQYPVEDDELIAGLAQDGTYFVWSRKTIFAIAGEPPSDNGTSGGLGTPRQLAASVGAASPLMCRTDLGIFFISERGPELLTRAQTIADPPIGRPVQNTFKAFPVCTSITLDAQQGLVYFELAESMTNGVATGNGCTIVFDLRLKRWISKDRRASSGGTPDVPAQSSAVVFDGVSAYRYAWLSTDGVVYVEDRTKNVDAGGTFVKKRARSSWIHAASLQGEQSVDRVMLLADYATAHDLTLTVEFDYNPASANPRVFTAAQLAAIVAGGKMWVDRDITPSTSTAIRVTVEDATPSSGVVDTGEGATWIGLAFPGIQHRGVRRTSAAQRGGT